MGFLAGQGVLGRIRFKDGQMPTYDRTYLVVKAEEAFIEVLNVSTIRGKERKLFFPHNERLRLYRPPFMYPSFVKLDSLMRINIADVGDLRVLHNGQTLDSGELKRIKLLLQRERE